MHEFSITRSILDILDKIVKDNKVKKLKRINFEISSIAHIEPDSIKFYYDFMTKENNALKDAELKFKKKKPEIECGDCKKKYEVENLFIGECPKCSGKNIKIADYEEIKIVSVEA